jgi:uncharacterized phage protein (TIGR02218 family)
MPRTVPTNLAAHYATGQTTLAWGLKITRKDAAVYGFTSHQRDVTVSSVLYKAGPGLDVQSLASSAGMAVDNTELTILPDDTIFTRTDILAGRWDGAAFELFLFNWRTPADGRDVLMAGTLGQVKPQRGAYVVELRGLQQYLQQPVGAVSTKTCRARLGDAACGINLASYTVTGTLTGVTSQTVFTDTARTEADHYFAEGTLTWTSGNNDGLSARVRLYAADTFTLAVPALGVVQVGDTYSVHAGCRKRLTEDCLAKFDNVLNFQGEPHRPTVDDLTASPEPNAE